jgi:hypothetical protein
MEDDAILVDIDTPEALAALQQNDSPTTTGKAGG